MNCHTLLDYYKDRKFKLLSLILFSLLSLSILNQITVSFAQGQDTILLSTNKNYYSPGDTVLLNGTVTGPAGQLVAVQVKDSSGSLILIRVIQADENGYFTLKFKIPPTASSGAFSIAASAKINGFITTQTKTVNATVPEFGSTTSIVLGLSVLTMTFLQCLLRLKSR